MVDTIFCDLYIPVTELIPDKVMNFLNCDTEFELIHVLCHFFCQTVYLGKDPSVCRFEQEVFRFFYNVLLHVHHDKS